MKIKIEIPEHEDALELAELECQCYATNSEKYAFWMWTLAIRYHYALKAILDGKIVGGMVATPTNDDRIYLDTLVVLEEHRGKGIGSELFRRMLSKLSDKKLVALIWIGNEIPKYLLEKHGFRAIHQLDNLFSSGKNYIEYER
jgi:ribosomal protein S18 acetylase RimI-like enzyme